MESYLPELRESIEISLPDEEAVLDEAEENSKYLNFISNTLDGDPVTSAVFYDYDMTVVNFWASYCEEDNINELDTLQSFYKDLQKKHPNVNFVQVVIDTPRQKKSQPMRIKKQALPSQASCRTKALPLGLRIIWRACRPPSL